MSNLQLIKFPESTTNGEISTIDSSQNDFGPFFIEHGKELKPNHRAMVAEFGRTKKTVFVQERKAFARYNEVTGIWEPISENALKEELAELICALAAEAKQPEIGHKLTGAVLRALLDMLKITRSPHNQTRPNSNLVPLTNGVLDFSAMPPVLLGHTPDRFFQNGAGLKYDPTAACPKFKQFLGEALPPEDVSLIQRYFGSILVGPNSDHKILILKGKGGTGKSTVVTVLERIIGLHYVADLRTKHLGGRFELSDFLGKRLLSGKDVPGDALSEKGAQMLKSLVGGDRLQAEIKYAGKSEVWGNFHVIISCNANLRIAIDQDVSAWQRRLLVVNYNRNAPTVVIQQLAEQFIREEADGIFNWMVEGAQAHATEVKEHGSYVLTETQLASIDSLLGESQSCQRFVEEQIVKSESADISVQELMEAYYAYCNSKNWKAVSENEALKSMPTIMLALHHQAKRHDIARNATLVRGYKHVALK